MISANTDTELLKQFDGAVETMRAVVVQALKKDPGQAILLDQIRALIAEQAQPQVQEHRKRRWTEEQKRRILQEAAAARAKKWGNVRQVCEKYHITSAHLTQWKHQLAG